MRRNKSLSNKSKLGILLFGLLGLVTNSHAALQNLGNGLVNDDILNVTWMQDANLVKTSCDAENELWQAFDLTTVTPNSGRTKQEICAANGDLTWHEAEAWILLLNNQNYLGGGWRQPAKASPDTGCSVSFFGGYGYDCTNTGSELNHLFYSSLGNPDDSTAGTCFNSTTGDDCLDNTGPFVNAQPAPYWFGTDAFFPGTAWNFHAGLGRIVFASKNGSTPNLHLNVWPVRSGLSAVPPPQAVPSLSIWGLGVMSLLLAFVARRKAR